jgi:hypothetical protein
MYNLLITAHAGVWDKGIGQFDFSRFLEYTDDDIKARFGTFDEQSVHALLGLPALFAYESHCELHARVGTITDLRVRDRGLRISLQFDPAFAPISPDALEDLQMELDIAGWELSRTHWAVKRVDLLWLLRNAGFASGVDVQSLESLAKEPALEELVRIVRQSLEKNSPVEAIDRLHTLTTKYLRARLQQRGIAVDKSKPLHSIFGEYVRALHEAGHVESKMTASILKSMHGPLEAFNQVRNDHSLAHDNVALLNHNEALFIFSHVTNSLKFLRELEQRITGEDLV